MEGEGLIHLVMDLIHLEEEEEEGEDRVSILNSTLIDVNRYLVLYKYLFC